MIDIRRPASLALPILLAACVSSPPSYVRQTEPQTSAPPPPMRPTETQQPTTAPGFRAPQIMQLRGLEGVIGSSASQLERRFGPARLRVPEGDALKLQFSGEPCVLDVYLYPTSPGAAPSATHVEARRASDGRHVDRASCVEALRRR